MTNKLKLLTAIVAATVVPTLVTTSSHAWSGTGYSVGDFYYENWSDSYGNTMNCSSYNVGDFTYTNCY
tara:strand:+ start:381 stop:584 length:204 start_codon:yes stop_codon:yes gene_type:complete